MAKHNYSDPGDDLGSPPKARNRKSEKRKRKAWDAGDLENEWYDQLDDFDDYRFK